MTEGILYIVATPIGNLGDITFRAIETLKNVDCILAEDTRHSKQLLIHFGIQKPLISVHEHNERERIDTIIQKLRAGQQIALISDAGTPLISDPGFPLVQAVIAAGIFVVPIPGVCAAITALSVAGLPTDRFMFEGFLPAKSSARRKRLQEIVPETRTIIFYESVHRIVEMLEDLILEWGEERKAVVCRELTKRFETIQRGTLQELADWIIAAEEQQRGEFVVIVAGAKAADTSEEVRREALRILLMLMEELPLKQAVNLAAKISGFNRNQLYQLALAQK